MNCEQFLFTRSVLFVSHLSKHKHRWPGDCLCKYFAILTTMGRCEFCLFADKLCIWSFAFFHLLLATCYLLAASGWWLATHLASPVGAPPPSAPISNVWPTIKANQPASQPASQLESCWPSCLATVFFVLVFAVVLLSVALLTARIRLTLCNKFAYVINRLPTVEY